MLANFDLNHLLTFPIKDDQARKQFLIGTLVYLAGFIVPNHSFIFCDWLYHADYATGVKG
jgi:hypothetical protein